MYPTQSTPPLVDLAAALDETKVSPGILGFIVFALLGGAVWLLLKSLTRHMKRIDFEEEPVPPGEEPGGGTSGSSPSQGGDSGAGTSRDEPAAGGEASDGRSDEASEQASDETSGTAGEDRPDDDGDDQEKRDDGEKRDEQPAGTAGRSTAATE